MELVALALVLVACGPAGTETPESTGTPLGLPTDVGATVKETMSARLDVPADEIEIISVTHVQWSDACLGLKEPDEICAQVITPGWQITIRAEGVEYILHTNESADVIRVEE
jgi:hypothetical protein